MKADTITHNGVKYISINDLISYFDNTAMEFESKKSNPSDIQMLNKLADALSKIL